MRKSMFILVCLSIGAGSLVGVAHGAAYSNDFSSADAVDEWTVIAGSWTLDSGAGQYANTTTGETALSVYTGTFAGGVDASALRDYTVAVEVGVNGGGSAVVARYKDSANYYMFRYKGATGELQLYRFANGATNIATETINPATVAGVHTLVFTLRGRNLTGAVYSGASELGSVSATDDTHSSGSVGLREWDGSSTFNSINVEIIGNSYNPSPADATADVPLDATLTWDTGLDPENLSQPNPAITKHYLYMSTDVNDLLYNWQNFLVDQIPAGSPTAPNASYKPVGLMSDKTYYWAVDESVNDSGPDDPATILGNIWSFQTITTLPEIVSGPNDTFAGLNGPGEMSVVAASISTVHYAWYKGNVGDTSAPVGTDSPSLVIDNVQPTDEGSYWCRITNAAGSADSGTATLHVKRLLAHWTFDQADFSAGQYTDVAGGNNATVAGEPNFITGADGSDAGAVVIDATNGWAIDGTWDPNEGTGSMTISVWANWYGINSQHQRLISKRDVDWGTTRWHILVPAYSTTVEFESFADGSGPTATMIDDGGWQHVCVSFDGSVATFYANGTDEFDMASANSATVALTPNMAGSAINLGTGKSDGTLWFNGALDDMRIYNYPMSALDVAELWSETTGKGACLYPPGADLNGDCKMDLADMAILASQWLDCGLYPASFCQ